MIVYRICQTYPPDHDPIDGVGAYKHGGRWNSIGTHVVYTSESLALARSELARHLNLEVIPDGFRVYEIRIPDGECKEIKPLPDNWHTDPEPESAKKTGDQHLQHSDTLCFKVPSVCDPLAHNYLLNPRSTRYAEVKIIRDYPFVP